MQRYAQRCSEIQDLVKLAKCRISLGPFKHGQRQTTNHLGQVTDADQRHSDVVIFST
jgi:hypothetical protein